MKTPFQGKLRDQRSLLAVGERDQLPILLDLARPKGVAIFQARRRERLVHRGQLVARPQTALSRLDRRGENRHPSPPT